MRPLVLPKSAVASHKAALSQRDRHSHCLLESVDCGKPCRSLEARSLPLDSTRGWDRYLLPEVHQKGLGLVMASCPPLNLCADYFWLREVQCTLVKTPVTRLILPVTEAWAGQTPLNVPE
jgi:hypothetical protein